jgi:hypothetical protein
MSRDCSSDFCRPLNPRDIERDSQRLFRWIRSIEEQQTNVIVDEVFFTTESTVEYLNVRVKNWSDCCKDIFLYLVNENLETLTNSISFNDEVDNKYIYYKVPFDVLTEYFILSTDLINILGTVVDPKECEFIYPIQI